MNRATRRRQQEIAIDMDSWYGPWFEAMWAWRFSERAEL